MGSITERKYTIIITELDGQYAIHPGEDTSWILDPGDSIQFINATTVKFTVNADPAVFLSTPFDLTPNSSLPLPVSNMSGKTAALEIFFTIHDKNGVETLRVTGGPRMVVTES